MGDGDMRSKLVALIREMESDIAESKRRQIMLRSVNGSRAARMADQLTGREGGVSEYMFRLKTIAGMGKLE
jgi:hypothetical protein